MEKVKRSNSLGEGAKAGQLEERGPATTTTTPSLSSAILETIFINKGETQNVLWSTDTFSFPLPPPPRRIAGSGSSLLGRGAGGGVVRVFRIQWNPVNTATDWSEKFGRISRADVLTG